MPIPLFLIGALVIALTNLGTFFFLHDQNDLSSFCDCLDEGLKSHMVNYTLN